MAGDFYRSHLERLSSVGAHGISFPFRSFSAKGARRLTPCDLGFYVFICAYLRPNEFYNNQLFSRSQIVGMSFIEINLFP